MTTLYDGNGNTIEINGGGATSNNFDVKEYATFEDNQGSARQATLTYKNKKLYPKTYKSLIVDDIKKYNGGIMIAFGDSYTYGMTSLFDNFATKHGLVACDNRGVIGSKIAGNTADSPLSFWERLDTVISDYTNGYAIGEKTYTCNDVKLITFMGGANDGWTTNMIGKGIYESSKTTIYGALHYEFSQLIKNFPNADIVVILQPAYSNSIKGTGLTTDEQAQQYGFDTLAQVQAMTDESYSVYQIHKKESVVREVAEYYGLPICDCVFEWYTPANSNEVGYWTADGHMTATGYEKIIETLEPVVNNLKFTRS